MLPHNELAWTYSKHEDGVYCDAAGTDDAEGTGAEGAAEAAAAAAEAAGGGTGTGTGCA